MQFELSRSFTNLASLSRQAGRLNDALDAWRQSIALVEPLDAERSSPASPEAWRKVLQIDSGELDEARRSCEQARSILEELVKDDPGNLEYKSDLGQVLSDLARALVFVGRDRDAADSLGRAIETHRAVVSMAPNVALYQPRLAADEVSLARTANTPVEHDIAQKKNPESP